MHHWEHFDSRLLVCEAYLLPNSVIEQKKVASLKKSFKAGSSKNQIQQQQQQRKGQDGSRSNFRQYGSGPSVDSLSNDQTQKGINDSTIGINPNDFQSLSDSTNNNENESSSSINSECLVVSMFFNADKGLLVYDSYARGEIYSKLISVRIPYHFFVTKVICEFSVYFLRNIFFLNYEESSF